MDGRGGIAGIQRRTAVAFLLSASVHAVVLVLLLHLSPAVSQGRATGPTAGAHPLQGRLTGPSAAYGIREQSAIPAVPVGQTSSERPQFADTQNTGPNAPYYYSASELDRRPRPITAIDLDEPGQAAPEGYLILRLLIDEAGQVDDVIVVLNDAPPALERNARAAFTKARYAPGLKNGQPVKSQLMIEVKLDAGAG